MSKRYNFNGSGRSSIAKKFMSHRKIVIPIWAWICAGIILCTSVILPIWLTCWHDPFDIRMKTEATDQQLQRFLSLMGAGGLLQGNVTKYKIRGTIKGRHDWTYTHTFGEIESVYKEKAVVKCKISGVLDLTYKVPRLKTRTVDRSFYTNGGAHIGTKTLQVMTLCDQSLYLHVKKGADEAKVRYQINSADLDALFGENSWGQTMITPSDQPMPDISTVEQFKLYIKNTLGDAGKDMLFGVYISGRIMVLKFDRMAIGYQLGLFGKIKCIQIKQKVDYGGVFSTQTINLIPSRTANVSKPRDWHNYMLQTDKPW